MGLSGPENIVNDHKTVCPDEHIFPFVGHAAEMTDSQLANCTKSLANIWCLT